MKKMTTLVIGVLLAGGLAVAPAIAASASAGGTLGFGPESGGAVATTETQSRETRAGNGAYWYWGVGQNVWSHYLNNNQCHGATAVGKTTKRVTGVPAWSYAKAEAPAKLTGNQAFYHLC